MKTCNCTLPYFNGPEVCNGCSNNIDDFIDNSTYPWNPGTNPYDEYPKTKTIKKVTKTVEKFDKDGNYIGKEVITEDQQEVVTLESFSRNSERVTQQLRLYLLI